VQIRRLVGQSSTREVAEFEARFAAIVGDGRAISFAAGRMGFYALMKVLGIGPGDEVVIHGATCSVMVNAVLRIGATPVFSDIDPQTFGSSALHIEKCLTSRTRMIVAQHSFGIPCDIVPIVAIAQSRGIFLLEDCALALGSRVDGVVVGNFGDAALFSTDHSKPLNTLIGGLLYTRRTDLASKLLDVQAATSELPVAKQQELWRRFLRERRYCHAGKYARMGVVDLLRSRLFNHTLSFLAEDYGVATSSSYPYPAKLPAFLAAVGIHEIMRWPQVAAERRELLNRLLMLAASSEVRCHIPKAYLDRRLEIVPLRFAWSQPDGASVRHTLSRFVLVSWTWFLQPISATSEPLDKFGYQKGTCPISERIGPGMVNLPCNLSGHDSRQLIRMFGATLSVDASK